MSPETRHNPEAVPGGLAALEQRLAKDLECLGWPARDWMPQQGAEHGVPVLDVAIVGAGQAGLAAAAALAQHGIHALVFDRAPLDFEGPWATTARMETLRSPKELTGPALGLPALTFRAWFEAQFGADEWARLDGCVYCTSVHAQRFEQLAKRSDLIEQVFEDPATAGTSEREKAIVKFSAELTLRPDALGAEVVAGGEQQMLCIARALMSRPKLLPMDEPSMGAAYLGGHANA